MLLHKVILLFFFFFINIKENSSYFLKPISSPLNSLLSSPLSSRSYSSIYSTYSNSLPSSRPVIAEVDILVAGAGISGTSASYEAISQGKSVALIDENDYIGGHFHSNKDSDYVWESGPNSFLPTPELMKFIAELGLSQEVVLADPSLPRFFYWPGYGVVKVPTGFFSFLSWPVMSLRGKWRMIKGLLGFHPPSPSSSSPSSLPSSESFEEFFTRHLGKEAYDRVIEPGLTGIFAGNNSNLGVYDCMPNLIEYEKAGGKRGSLLFGYLKKSKENKKNIEMNIEKIEKIENFSKNSPYTLLKPRKGSLGSFKFGLQTIPLTIQRRLEFENQLILKNSSIFLINRDETEKKWYVGIVPSNSLIEIRELEKKLNEANDENRDQLKKELKNKRDNLSISYIKADGLMLTIPSYSLAEIFSHSFQYLSSSLSREDLERIIQYLNEVYYPPMISVALAYPSKEFRAPLKGFGHLMSRVSGLRTLGCIWTSALFPGRCPPDQCLLISFLGGGFDSQAASLSDDELVRQADEDHRAALLKPTAPFPRVLKVGRINKAIPQYYIGHRDKMNQVKDVLSVFPCLQIGGNYMGNPSIGDCIRESREGMRNLVQKLNENS